MVGSISSELKMQGTEVVIEDVDAGARRSKRRCRCRGKKK